MTIYGTCVAIQEDTRGYINYVFKLSNIEEEHLVGFKNLTCVRYPNWECKPIQLGDYGYIVYENRKAGIDTWYDGKQLVPYKYDAVQFINFIRSGKSVNETCIL